MEVRLQQRELEAVESDFYRRYGKRAFDFAAASVGLLLLSPLLAVCALLVRLFSRGPVLFRQIRLGRHGGPFTVYKFRTMRVGADCSGPSVVVPGDPRLTPVGGFLRRTKLDELPQLINVLRGDMSLVGPRPRVPSEVALERSEERRLLTVRPGMTSYASIYHRMEADYCAGQDNPKATHHDVILPQKSYLDLEYLERLSFGLDVKLVLLTLLLVFVPGKASPGVVQLFGLQFRTYSRAGQMLLETGVFAAAVWLAYSLRFEGAISEFSRAQRAAFLVLIPAARLATNQVLGVYRMIWRYVNLTDAVLLATSLSVPTAILLLLRLFLPSQIGEAHVFQLPLGVIAMEYLLALSGGLGLRTLRRALYEMNQCYQPLPVQQKRRILILGAGLSGLGIALGMSRHPHLQLVGFVDDDPAKHGRVIAGSRVLGASEDIGSLIRRHQVSDLIVCAQSVPLQALERIQDECRALGAKAHVIPTLDQILSSDAVESSPLRTAS